MTLSHALRTMPMVPVQTARNKGELHTLDWIGHASRYRTLECNLH